jgi:DNA primase
MPGACKARGQKGKIVRYTPRIAQSRFRTSEISRFYAARVPDLRQTDASQWRGSCPIHHGRDDNFAVEAATGRWFCHSQCGRGGGIIALEMELSGTDFTRAKAEVYRLIGRTPERARRRRR